MSSKYLHKIRIQASATGHIWGRGDQTRRILLRPVSNMAVICSRDRGWHVGFRRGRHRRMAKWMPFWRRSASHKQVIYMATFLTRFRPFCQDFRHFLLSARGKLGLIHGS